MKEVDRDFWKPYLDYILTFSREPWAHFGHLAQVVQAHVAAGIKIQPWKTKLFQFEVEYLGLANTVEWQGGRYILGICGVLSTDIYY